VAGRTGSHVTSYSCTRRACVCASKMSRLQSNSTGGVRVPSLYRLAYVPWIPCNLVATGEATEELDDGIGGTPTCENTSFLHASLIFDCFQCFDAVVQWRRQRGEGGS